MNQRKTARRQIEKMVQAVKYLHVLENEKNVKKEGGDSVLRLSSPVFAGAADARGR